MSKPTRVEFRPAVSADFDGLSNEPLPFRVRAMTAHIGGKVLGVGGFGFPPDGTIIAFVHAHDEAHRYKVSFHRAGLKMMAEARRLGFHRVVALASPDKPNAGAWLKRLGFMPQEIDGQQVYIWKSDLAHS